MEFQPRTAPPLASLFPKASADCVDLLSKLVALDPRKRLSAQAALQHRCGRRCPVAASSVVLR